MRLYNEMLSEFSEGLWGYSTIAIIGQSCLGSIAVMLILMQGTNSWQITQLTFVTMACMVFNGAVLSQQRPKLIFNLLIASVLVSLFTIILNF